MQSGQPLEPFECLSEQLINLLIRQTLIVLVNHSINFMTRLVREKGKLLSCHFHRINQDILPQFSYGYMGGPYFPMIGTMPLRLFLDKRKVANASEGVNAQEERMRNLHQMCPSSNQLIV